MKPKPHKKGGSNGKRRKKEGRGGYTERVAAYLASCELQRDMTPEEANAERARLRSLLSKSERDYADMCLESLYYNGDCG